MPIGDIHNLRFKRLEDLREKKCVAEKAVNGGLFAI